jgi:hypothetical protein
VQVLAQLRSLVHRSRLRFTATRYRTSVAHSAAPESAVANPPALGAGMGLVGEQE